jgi:protein LTV1
MVLNPTQAPNASSASRAKHLGDLASELGSTTESVRDNEGEAAEYGVYFDDTEYDYMQHLRDLGDGDGDAGEVVFLESKASQKAEKAKGKQKQSLEDALRQLDIEQKSEDLLDEDILPSKNLQRLTYQAQQDVPDVIAGFQPDMDPRLREVLEALEDEAYVDDEGDEDFFQQLAKDGQELEKEEFEEGEYEDEDEDGWETDDTAKPAKRPKDDEVPMLVETSAHNGEASPQDWLDEFDKFKKDQKGAKKPTLAEKVGAESSIWTTTTNGGRRKKRKGALTSQTGYSMTSSSLVRTEQLTILDGRFDKIAEHYNEDADDMLSASGVSSISSVQGPVRSDFDGIMDEFLQSEPSHRRQGLRRGKGNAGVQELDQIRRELGPAKIRTKHR